MLLKDLRISLLVPPMIWCDNIGALALASNPVYHARTKHIEVDYHFIREKVVNKDVLVKSVSTHNQLADVFTKGLTSTRFYFLRTKLKVVPVPPLACRGLLDNTPSISHDNQIIPITHADMLPPSQDQDQLNEESISPMSCALQGAGSEEDTKAGSGAMAFRITGPIRVTVGGKSEGTIAE